jgi:hypothetical protein
MVHRSFDHPERSKRFCPRGSGIICMPCCRYCFAARCVSVVVSVTLRYDPFRCLGSLSLGRGGGPSLLLALFLCTALPVKLEDVFLRRLLRYGNSLHLCDGVRHLLGRSP